MSTQHFVSVLQWKRFKYSSLKTDQKDVCVCVRLFYLSLSDFKKLTIVLVNIVFFLPLFSQIIKYIIRVAIVELFAKHCSNFTVLMFTEFVFILNKVTKLLCQYKSSFSKKQYWNMRNVEATQKCTASYHLKVQWLSSSLPSFCPIHQLL